MKLAWVDSHILGSGDYCYREPRSYSEIHCCGFLCTFDCLNWFYFNYGNIKSIDSYLNPGLTVILLPSPLFWGKISMFESWQLRVIITFKFHQRVSYKKCHLLAHGFYTCF